MDISPFNFRLPKELYIPPDWVKQSKYTGITITFFGCEAVVYLMEDGSYAFPDKRPNQFLSIEDFVHEWVRVNIPCFLYRGTYLNGYKELTSPIRMKFVKIIQDAIAEKLNEVKYKNTTPNQKSIIPLMIEERCKSLNYRYQSSNSRCKSIDETNHV